MVYVLRFVIFKIQSMKTQSNHNQNFEASKPAGFDSYAWKTFQKLSEKVNEEKNSWDQQLPIPCPEFYYSICDKNQKPVIAPKYLKFLKNEWNAEWQELLLIEAKNLMRLKKFDEALDNLQLAERIFAANEEVLLQLGILHHKMQHIHSCLHYYQKTIHFFPYAESAYSRRALLYFQLDQDKKALQDVQRALSLNPNSAFSWRLKIGIEAVAKNFEAAEKAAFKLIALQPNAVLAYQKLADIQLLMQKKQSAISTLKHILYLDSNNAEAHLELARIYAKQNLKLAQEHFEKAKNVQQSESKARMVA